MRKLPLALACALVLGSSNAFAIGLGELQTQSYLNQPLRAVIPITDVRPGELDALSVKIGDEAQFARHGYSLFSVYGRVKLQVVGGGYPHILLTSDAPVRDPALGLVLVVDNGNARLERAVSILLDPEGYRPAAVAKTAAAGAPSGAAAAGQSLSIPSYAAGSAASSRRAAAKPMPMPDGGDYTVVSGDTAYGIASRVKPDGVGVQQTIDMILQSNPHAFANPSDASTLLAGKTLKIPNAQVMRQARTPAAPVSKPSQGGAAPATAAPATSAAPSAEPRLDIVQPTAPTTPSVPAVVAPVVGEVVSGVGAAANAPVVSPSGAPQTALIPAEVQEQIEATKVENERLTGLLASQDERLQKMEELLRLNEGLIKELEQKLSAAAPAPVAPVAAPVESAAPWWSTWVMGLGAVLAAVLAYAAGSRRRAKDEPAKQAEARPPVVTLDKREEATVVAPVPEPAVVVPASTAAVAAAATAASSAVIPDSADPVKAALEEADVMQAYGLHDRAIQVLSDALLQQPGNALLMARRVRAMHEAGDAEGFLREAEAFRDQHPMDEALWADIRALGEAHYASSSLFAAGSSATGGDEALWRKPESTPAPAPAQDETLDLILPLEGLDLGTPEAALNDLLSAPKPAQGQAAEMDVSSLDLDLPLELPPVTSLGEKQDTVGSSPQAQEQVAEEWAPLELPTDDKALAAWGLKDAPGVGAASPAPSAEPESLGDISADDLATLGIDFAQDLDLSSAASSDLQTFDLEFAEAQPEAAPPEKAVPSLDLDFIPSPLPDAVQLESVPEVTETALSVPELEPLELPSLTLEETPAQEMAPLSQEIEPVISEIDALAPLELPTEAPSVAPGSSLQGETPLTLGGMVSEHEVKLDIASAYIDMGDLQGAREMLQEVLASDCDELLRDRAQNMLAQLSV